MYSDIADINLTTLNFFQTWTSFDYLDFFLLFPNEYLINLNTKSENNKLIPNFWVTFIMEPECVLSDYIFK